MTTTFVTRTADFVPALQPAQLYAPPASSFQDASVQGTGMSATTGRGRCNAAALHTGLVADVITSVERHVAVIGTSQVVTPVVGTAVSGLVFGGKGVPALRTWRPPV